jgi:hypothetical protein
MRYYNINIQETVCAFCWCDCCKLVIDNARNLQYKLHFILTVHLCIIHYFYQQMHQDKFVTVFFIERVPQIRISAIILPSSGFF